MAVRRKIDARHGTTGEIRLLPAHAGRTGMLPALQEGRSAGVLRRSFCCGLAFAIAQALLQAAESIKNPALIYRLRK